jgi:hypothetical protein
MEVSEAILRQSIKEFLKGKPDIVVLQEIHSKLFF